VIVILLWLLFIGILVSFALVFIASMIGSPKTMILQKDTDLRLTYKRYMQIYPSARITYDEYKRMQVQRAYKKAVSSMKIKRMVR